MLLVQVQNSDGQVTRQVRASGEQLTLLEGQSVRCHVDTGSLTSLVREGDALRFFLNNAILIEVLNFFDVDNNGLQFEDQQFSVEEIASKLTLHVTVTQDEQAARYLEAEPGSRIRVYDGDKFEFNNAEVTPDDLHRRGSDLRVDFHLDHDGAENYLDLVDFFRVSADQARPPVVVLADADHQTTDMFVQPQRQNFRLIASPTTIATAGMMYAFYFIIQNFDPDKSHVDVSIDGKALPEWLSLNHMGKGKFSLSGIPPSGFEGTNNVEIKVRTKEDQVNVHTQESYKLVVSARPEMTERAAVVGVITAETRGAVATHSSESFMAGSQSALAGTAPLAIVAALSSLSVFSAVRAARLEGGEFSTAHALDFLSEKIEIEFGGLNLGATTLLGDGSSSGFGDFGVGSGALANDRRFEAREHEDREPPDDEGSEYTGDVTLSFDEQISSYDTAAANFAGNFFAYPDTIQTNENDVVVIQRPGLLENDVNEQTPYELIVRVMGDAHNVSKKGEVVVIEIPSVIEDLPPALLTVYRRGDIVYDPNGAWEFLAQGEVNSEHTFDYTLSNLLSESGALVTIEVTGENDNPFIFNQTFTINENSPIGALVNEQYIVGDDVDYSDTPLLELTELNGQTGGFQVSLTGNFVPTGPRGNGETHFNLSVENQTLLNYEQTPTFQFNVTLTDRYGATDTAKITVNLLNVNEAPIVIDQHYTINEFTPNSTPLGTLVGDFNADDEDLADGDVLHFFNNTPLEDAIIIQDATDSSGEIFVSDPSQFNYELFNGVAPEITFQVRVDDEGPLDGSGGRIGPSLSSVATVTITILNVNESPTVAVNQVFNILEQTPGNLYAPNYIIGQLVADDPDLAISSEGENLSFTDLDHVSEFNITSNPAPNLANLVIQNANQLNFETNPQVVFTLEVEDAGKFVDVGNSNTVQGTVTVNIVNVNETPEVNDQLNFTIAENVDLGSVAAIIQATDPDLADPSQGEALTFTDDSGTLANIFSLVTNTSNNTGVISTIGAVDFEQLQGTTFTVRVTDAGHLLPNFAQVGNAYTDTATITITIENVNEAPTLDSGNSLDVYVSEFQAAGLIGTYLADDPDFAYAATGDYLSFTDDNTLDAAFGLNTSGPVGQYGELSLDNPAQIDYEVRQLYTFTVRAYDAGIDGDSLSTGTQTVNIHIVNVNENPVLDSGNDLNITLTEDWKPGLLRAYTADDPDLYYGPSNEVLTFSDNNTIQGPFQIAANGELTLTGPLDFEAQDGYQFTLFVQDAGIAGGPVLSDMQTVTVTILNVNEAPELSAANNLTITIAEDQVAGLLESFAATDPDLGVASNMEMLTYLHNGTLDSAFTLTTSGAGGITGELSLVGTIDYEAQQQYTFDMSVQDAGNDGPVLSSDIQTVTINITNVNENPFLSSDNALTISIYEDQAPGYLTTYFADDPDLYYGPTNEVLTISDLGTIEGPFSLAQLDSTVAELSLTGPLDFETLDNYEFTVNVHDAGIDGATLSDYQTVHVTILNVNEAPELDIGNVYTIDVSEDALPGTLLTFLADDPDFGAASGEALTFIDNGTLDPVFSLTTSGLPGEEIGTLSLVGQLDYETLDGYTFTLTVQDSGNVGLGNVLSASHTVTINVLDANDAPVLDPVDLLVSENATNGDFGVIVATDQDVPADTLTYSLVSGGNGIFEVLSDGTIRVIDDTALNHEVDDRYALEVEVSDGTATTVGQVTVYVGNVTPTFADNITINGVVENTSSSVNTANGTIIGNINDMAIVDTDLDQATLVFSESTTNVSSVFDVLANGDIIVQDESALDYEASPSFDLHVSVSDGSDIGETVVTINLVNDNDAPVILDQTIGNVSENVVNGAVVGQIVATDADTDISNLTFTDLSNSTVYTVNSDGSISVADASVLNFEDSNNNSHTLEVQVTDSTGPTTLTDTAFVTINLINEQPVITTGQEFYVLQYTATDTVIGQIALDSFDTDSAQATLTFSEVSPTTNAFKVAANGEILVQNSSRLDGTPDSYTMGVSVNDGSDSDSTSVLIHIDDLLVDLNGGSIGINNSATWIGSGSVNIASSSADIREMSNVIVGMTIAITNLANGSDEILSIASIADDVHVAVGTTFSDGQGGVIEVTQSTQDGSGILVLSGEATRAAYENILQDIGYHNTATTVDSTARSIQVTVDDGNITNSATTTMQINVSPLVASEGEAAPIASAPVADLHVDQAEALLGAAEHYWDQVINVHFDGVTVSVQDLPGDLLGLAGENSIVIDINAAGHGWFVDGTPLDSAEFTVTGDPNVLVSDGSGIDLLTVLMHELGHVIGVDEHTQDGLMASDLASGVRVLPDSSILNDGMELNFAVLDTTDSSQNGSDGVKTLADIDGNEVLQDANEISFSSSDTSSAKVATNDETASTDTTQTDTHYADDLMAQANSVNDHTYNGSGSFGGDYSGLVVNDQESVV